MIGTIIMVLIIIIDFITTSSTLIIITTMMISFMAYFTPYSFIHILPIPIIIMITHIIMALMIHITIPSLTMIPIMILYSVCGIKLIQKMNEKKGGLVRPPFNLKRS